MPPTLPSPRSRLRCGSLSLLAVLVLAHPGRADELPVVADVEFQPLAAQVRQVVEALDMLGQPLPEAARARLDRALGSTGGPESVRTIQEVLDPLCLVGVSINPESRVKAVQGPAAPVLVQHGWRGFPGKGANEGGGAPPPAAPTPHPPAPPKRGA